MPRSDAPPVTRGVVLRALGLTVAIGLGALGVWLIAKGDSTKRVQIGAFAGFWGLLIGAFAIFGTRRLQLEDPSAVGHGAGEPGSALELRSKVSELERANEAMQRREHEERLERMLQREIQAAVAREVGTLRAEIAELRSDLLEKVGGQLRLERIETTRVLGSDLEALQHELQELKHAARDGDPMQSRVTEKTSMRQIVEPARVRPVTRETAAAEAEVLPARQPRPEPEPVRASEPEPEPEPVGRAEPEPESEPVMQAPAQPAPPEVASTEETRPIRMPPREARPAPTVAEPTVAEPTRREPVAEEPVREEPVAEEPVAEEPVADEPTVAEPAVAEEPAAEKPVAEEPVVAEPAVAEEPVHEEPVAEEPVAVEPVADEPVAEEPNVPERALPTAGIPTRPEPRPAAAAAPAASEPGPSPATPGDPFAGLPRIRPFTDFELDPIEDEPSYTGRRRRGDEVDRSSGRHSRGAEDPGGRRRAPDDGDDLLARLLARENAGS